MSIEFLAWVMAICLALFPIGCYLDALLGGWRTLAARYPDSAKQRLGGLRMYFQTIYLEAVSKPWVFGCKSVCTKDGSG
jgi:hypothetical protein